MNLGDKWRQLWAQHRNAILAAGGATAVGAVVVIRKHGTGGTSSSANDVGYPAAISGGAVPTYDTTASDTASALGDAANSFTDQLTASQDWQQTQFDALDTSLGGLSDTVDTLSGRVGAVSTAIGKLKPAKAPAAPRPKKPTVTPKAHHKPPAKKPAPAKKAAPRKMTNPRRPTRPAGKSPIRAKPAPVKKRK